MATKTKKETSANGRGSRKSETKNAVNELQQVINNASSAVADAVEAGASAPEISAAGVISSSVAAGAVAAGAASVAAVPSGRASSAVAVLLDDDVKINAFRAAVCSHFAAPEWARAAELRALLAPAGLSSEAIESAIITAAKKEGVNLAPLRCSVPRALAVIRRYYKKEFETLTGKNFDAVIDYYKNGGVIGSYSLRLPLSLVRADSVSTNFLACVPLSGDASAAAVVSSLLSLRFFFSFAFALEGAKSAAKCALRSHLSDCWRAAVRLGLSLDDVMSELKDISYYVDGSDHKERTQLRKNLAHAWANINQLNDEILLAGGAEGDRAAKVAKLLAKRARFSSVVATCETLLK